MPSYSVWYEEVDKGLIKLIKSVLGDVPIHFNPNVNIPVKGKRVEYPLVKINHLGETFDKFRYNDAPIVVDFNPETRLYSMGQPAKPYTLKYQMTISSTSMSKLNNLTLKWNSFLTPHFNLDVLDKSGTPRSCNVTLGVGTSFSEEDSNETFIYNTVYTFNIWTELDEEVASKQVPRVEEVSLNDLKTGKF